MLSKERVNEIHDALSVGSLDNRQTMSESLDIITELLSLREQLAELKALEPVAWRNRFTGYLHSKKPGIVDIDDFYVELFTAAKPAED
ncbi:TPA: hypothetical protein ROW14_000317 [Yersinia enterocolitica]|nr:hypothetical protein [Yersinia enterocolitica]